MTKQDERRRTSGIFQTSRFSKHLKILSITVFSNCSKTKQYIRCWIRNKGTFLSSAEMKSVINTTLNIKPCTIECKLACGLSDNFVDGFGKSRITFRRGSYTSVDQTSLSPTNGLFDTPCYLRDHTAATEILSRAPKFLPAKIAA